MRLKLEKLQIPSEPDIEALPQDQLIALIKNWRQRLEIYQGIIFKARRQLYGSRSERSGSSTADASAPAQDPPAKRAETTKLPSERYPDAEIQVEEIDFAAPPPCPSCQACMEDSGMTETSEYLDVKPKEYIVVEQRRHKYRCKKCHGAIVTAPAPARVVPGGSYSDEIIVDSTLSKFCDLTPMGRYSQIAARGGLPGLPPQSLIQSSFRLADFVEPISQLIKNETLAAEVLSADETTHRMLEGDAKKGWYLWGFSTPQSCFFECHDTRSGDVSTEVLRKSNCLVLVSDVYSGYGKSLKTINKIRKEEEGRPPIKAAYCNAHARRGFFSGDADSPEISDDAKFMIDRYKKIYKLEAESKGFSPDVILQKRGEMQSHFAAMKDEALKKIPAHSNKSQLGVAYSYFLKNYDGFTLFLSNPNVPIDNNGSERLLRSPVVGRKTWYGTHSPRGAKVAAVHFSIVESCKLNQVNPREYYLDSIDRIHSKKELLTPWQYKEQQQKDKNDTC